MTPSDEVPSTTPPAAFNHSSCCWLSIGVCTWMLSLATLGLLLIVLRRGRANVDEESIGAHIRHARIREEDFGSISSPVNPRYHTHIYCSAGRQHHHRRHAAYVRRGRKPCRSCHVSSSSCYDNISSITSDEARGGGRPHNNTPVTTSDGNSSVQSVRSSMMNPTRMNEANTSTPLRGSPARLVKSAFSLHPMEHWL